MVKSGYVAPPAWAITAARSARTGAGQGSSTNVTIVNAPPGQHAVEETTDPQTGGKSLRVILADMQAGNVGSPQVKRAMASAFGVKQRIRPR